MAPVIVALVSFAIGVVLSEIVTARRATRRAAKSRRRLMRISDQWALRELAAREHRHLTPGMPIPAAQLLEQWRKIVDAALRL